MNTHRDPGRPDLRTVPIGRRVAIAATCAALAVATAGCGDDDDATAASSQPAAPSPAPQNTRPATTSPPTVAPVTTASEPTTSALEAETSSSTIVDDSWKEEAAAICAAYGAELPSEPPAVAGSAALLGFWRDLRDRLPSFDALDLPDELRTAPTDVPAVLRQADEYLALAEAAGAAGDDADVDLAVQQYLSLFEHSAALVTIAGAECGDPRRAANASLNVPIPNAGQVTAGLGSVWVSQGPFFTTVARVDPDSGQVLATIDLGVAPGKIQPADGRMIVRTADAYMAIDPTTNSIVGTLAKSDVGPAANRSWAVDGAMWICDGQRLHRYDPATFAPTGTVIELGIDCGQVYATGDLVVAWTYNEDDGESGTSAAAFVDPATNQLLATTALPVDVTVPIVLGDAVFLPANSGTQNVVVDRATWTVTATPDYGRSIRASQMAHAGRSIYLIADVYTLFVTLDVHEDKLDEFVDAITVNAAVSLRDELGHGSIHLDHRRRFRRRQSTAGISRPRCTGRRSGPPAGHLHRVRPRTPRGVHRRAHLSPA